jgi:hypothetical protein
MLREGKVCYESQRKSLKSIVYVSGLVYNSRHDDNL